MHDNLLAPVVAWIGAVISAAGYVGIVGMMAMESACVPLPSEVIMRGGAVERRGRYVLLGPGDLDHAVRFCRRFGDPVVLIGRLLSVVRTFIALPTGIARMPQPPFRGAMPVQALSRTPDAEP